MTKVRRIILLLSIVSTYAIADWSPNLVVKNCGMDYRGSSTFGGNSYMWFTDQSNTTYRMFYLPTSQLEFSKAQAALAIVLTAKSTGMPVGCNWNAVTYSGSVYKSIDQVQIDQ